jgi:AcrR family transcriptional regulator
MLVFSSDYPHVEMDEPAKVSGRGAVTRSRVIQAAVECILDEGYYRASSNRIADRAGVSWGVIRHHFGTRDRLLLAVLEALHGRLLATLREAAIEGATVEERLGSFITLLFTYYRHPDYLAGLQITLNLAREPATHQSTLDALSAMSAALPSELEDVFVQVSPGLDDADFRYAIFEIVRGLSIGLGIEDALHEDRVHRPENQAALLARALTHLFY